MPNATLKAESRSAALLKLPAFLWRNCSFVTYKWARAALEISHSGGSQMHRSSSDLGNTEAASPVRLPASGIGRGGIKNSRVAGESSVHHEVLGLGMMHYDGRGGLLRLELITGGKAHPD